MRHHRWYLALASVLLVMSSVACSGGTSATDQAQMSTPSPASPTVSATPTSSPTVTASSVPTVTRMQPSGAAPNAADLLGRVAENKVSTSQLPAANFEYNDETQQFVDTETAAALNYWASDFCHYYTSNGVLYGDYCVRSVPDEQGNAIPNSYVIYTYDQNAAGHLGGLLRFISVDMPGWVVYYDFNDPHFQQIMLAAYPSTVQAPTPENTMYYLTTTDGQTMWRSATEVVFTVPVYTVPGSSIQSGGVPAWDPSITVQTYSLWRIINDPAHAFPGIGY